jgi:multiple sugar transport system substrate-binding protein
MKKPSLSFISFMLLGTSLLAACSSTETSGGTAQTPKPGETAKPVSLKLWRAGTDQIENEYWKRAIKDYETSNPNIKIELTEIPFGNDMETKLTTSFLSGTSPDLISYSIASVAQRAELGHYAPLDEFVGSWSGKADMIEKVLDSGTYKGKLYGVGFIPDPRVFVWRKDLFKEAGLNPDKAPQTWEELADYAVKLTKKSGTTVTQAGFYIRSTIPNGDAAQDWQAFALQNGSKIIDTQKDEAFFDSPESIEAANYLTDLAKKGVTMLGKQEQDPFSVGKAAMVYTNPSTVGQLLKNKPELKGQVGFAPPIKRKGTSTFAGLRLMFIGAQSKNKPESWKFMTYITSKEETWKRYKELGAPIVLKSLKDQYIQDNPEQNGAIFDAVSVGQGYPIVPYSFSFMELISRALEQSYYGKKTPEQALKDAKAEFIKQLPSWTQKK